MTLVPSSNAADSFGDSRRLGHYYLALPVCIETLGDTWLGYITEGSERGRVVLITVSKTTATAGSRPNPFFRQAALAASSVRHPSVLAVLETLQVENELALVSEYLDGEPLGPLLAAAASQTSPIPQGVALRIISDAIEAIAQLSSGDDPTMPPGGLCPESIFIASYGEAMIRHPGLTEAALRQPAMRRHPAALSYRSPEQLVAPAEVDERTEVFSAGILLWEMLAGKPLFGEADHRRFGRLRSYRAKEWQAIEKRVRAAEIPSLATIPRPGGALHPMVIDLVDRALAKDPSERFADLTELKTAIEILPPGLVGDSDQVARTVERLSGARIARRQQQMSSSAPVPLRSSGPPSARVTSHPEEPHQTTVSVPLQKDAGRLQDLVGESQDAQPASARDSAPPSRRRTSPRRPAVVEPPVEAPTPPGVALGSSPKATKAASKLPTAPAKLPDVSTTQKASGGPVADTPTAPKPPSLAQPPEAQPPLGELPLAQPPSPKAPAVATPAPPVVPSTPETLGTQSEVPPGSLSPVAPASEIVHIQETEKKRGKLWIGLAAVILIAVGGAFMALGGSPDAEMSSASDDSNDANSESETGMDTAKANKDAAEADSFDTTQGASAESEQENSPTEGSPTESASTTGSLPEEQPDATDGDAAADATSDAQDAPASKTSTRPSRQPSATQKTSSSDSEAFRPGGI